MSSSENIGPGVVLKLAKELRSLSQSPPDGVKIVMNEDEVTDIAADITGPSCTAFDGGCAALRSKMRPRPPLLTRRSACAAFSASS